MIVLEWRGSELTKAVGFSCQGKVDEPGIFSTFVPAGLKGRAPSRSAKGRWKNETSSAPESPPQRERTLHAVTLILPFVSTACAHGLGYECGRHSCALEKRQEEGEAESELALKAVETELKPAVHPSPLHLLRLKLSRTVPAIPCFTAPFA